MARFRYKLQNILEIKMKMETQARQQFAQARRELDLALAYLAELKEKKERLEQEAIELLTGDLDFHDIDDNQLSRIFCDQQIAAQEAVVAKAEERLEQARQLL